MEAGLCARDIFDPEIHKLKKNKARDPLGLANEVFMKNAAGRDLKKALLLVGFALLFMGLEALKKSVPSFDEGGFYELIEPLTGSGIFSVIIFVFIGTLPGGSSVI